MEAILFSFVIVENDVDCIDEVFIKQQQFFYFVILICYTVENDVDCIDVKAGKCSSL